MTVYAMNAATLAVSEYLLPEVLGVAANGNERYFVTADGLLSHGDGAGVRGVITTGDLDLVGDASTALNTAYLQLEADGPMHLVVTAHQDGGDKSKRYLVPTRLGDNARDRRVRLGQGLMGNAWSFSMTPASESGCNWRLNGIGITLSRTKQRRR